MLALDVLVLFVFLIPSGSMSSFKGILGKGLFGGQFVATAITTLLLGVVS